MGFDLLKDKQTRLFLDCKKQHHIYLLACQRINNKLTHFEKYKLNKNSKNTLFKKTEDVNHIHTIQSIYGIKLMRAV